ncbi:endonuclease domain-containing protein [Kocuria arenosa]|uniref:endonuclease domain-containing protein n=1 Tax=Kocuria arenosa TaxID=3071446 RepID=UPI0034D47176
MKSCSPLADMHRTASSPPARGRINWKTSAAGCQSPAESHAPVMKTLPSSTCTWCGEWKPESEFGGRAINPDGLERQCKVCLKDRSRRARMRSRLKRYNLTAERWAQMVEDCHGQCPACHRTMSEKDMAIDHDHSCCPGRNISCGQCVRGIICHRCNLRIGYFLDDPEMMREVAAYLDRTKR